MSQFNLSATDIFAAIADNANLIKISADLCTLEENNGFNTIHVDSSITTQDFSISFTSIVALNSSLKCDIVEQTPDNTYILIDCEQAIIFNGECLDVLELCNNRDFQELLLGSRLSNLSPSNINKILANQKKYSSTEAA